MVKMVFVEGYEVLNFEYGRSSQKRSKIRQKFTNGSKLARYKKQVRRKSCGVASVCLTSDLEVARSLPGG